MPLKPFSLLAALLFASVAAFAEPAPSAPSGEKFQASKSAAARVLLAGGGSSHDFEKWFHKADTEILKTAGYDVAYSANVEEVLALLPQADVLVLSTNQKEFGLPAFQEALRQFVAGGKGVVVMHAG